MLKLNNIDPDAYYSTKETCKLLGVSIDALYKWNRLHRLVPKRKIGNRHLYLGKDLIEFTGR